MYPRNSNIPTGTPGAQGIQGEQGTQGLPGLQGTPGQPAYTETTADFIVPAIAASVTVDVANGLFGAGVFVHIEGAGYYEVVESTSASLKVKNLGVVGNTAATGSVTAGARIVPVSASVVPSEGVLDGTEDVVWDLAAKPSAVVTLTGNRTVEAPTNSIPGTFHALRIIQDATGSRTITWDAVFRFAGGTGPTLTTTAEAEDLLVFYCDGTNLTLISSTLDVS